MRVLVLFACLFHSICALADTASPGPDSARECVGRSGLVVPSSLQWQLSGGARLGVPFARFMPGGDTWQVDYGTPAFAGQAHLVTIDVSPLTTRTQFERLKGTLVLSRADAQGEYNLAEQTRVRHLMTPYLKAHKPSEYYALNERYKQLARTFERIHKIPGERAALEAMIADFAAKAWPIDTLQARLQRLHDEDVGYPLSDRFKWQQLPDFGLEDGYAVFNSGELSVVLWRQSRVYKLSFGYTERGISDDEALQRLDPHVRRLLGALRPRAAFEVPRQPGVCLPFGFLADDGTPPYAVRVAWFGRHQEALRYDLQVASQPLREQFEAQRAADLSLDRSAFPRREQLPERQFRLGQMSILQTTTLTKWYLEHDTDRRETFQLRAAHLGDTPVPSMILQLHQLHSREGLSLRLLEAETVDILGQVYALPNAPQVAQKGKRT
ncbi:hypothetical protein G3435_00880 [Pseudomonas sp. MAFF212428]|uniref:Tle cognate immunity protein 4 C-terminal domain-containing protein n=1 Tax=Pseudomonas brassicae TaxID=2708063 RepID=A0A6B3NVF8_9PSED|nr:hypothetical protein [Pseudomonas brassicae]NER58916.1 hypothetical protein [Pseudomonas brassicae]NER65783.1 hypothetical protein [Pseudomonas brassicae]